MEFICITSLEKYQHYKDRHMVWFKWYCDVLSDYKFMELSSEEKWVFIGLIALACKNDNKVDYNKKWLERTLNVKKIENSVNNLKCSNLLSICYQNAVPIREDKIREEEIREDNIPAEDTQREKVFAVSDNDIQRIWDKYPRKIGHKEAVRHIKATVLTPQDVQDCIKAISNYKDEIRRLNVEEKFIKHGSTFFNNWKDYVSIAPLPGSTKPRDRTVEEIMSAFNVPVKGMSVSKIGGAN